MNNIMAILTFCFYFRHRCHSYQSLTGIFHDTLPATIANVAKSYQTSF